MKKVLFFVYHYAPYNVTGTFRILRLAKYFAKNGFKPFIVTANEGEHHINNELLKDVPSNAEIIRINHIFQSAFVVDRDYLYKKDRSLIKSISWYALRLVKDILLNPDFQILWTLKALPAVARTIKKNKIEYLVVNGEPFSLMVGGYILSKFMNFKLILDFRDPWSNTPNALKQTWPKRFAIRFWERTCINAADIVFVVTPDMVDFYKSRYNTEKIHLIYNGIDPDDYQFSSNAYQRNDKFVFVYAGNLRASSKIYNPTTLLKGFALFIKSLPIVTQSSVLLRLFGDSDEPVMEMVESLGLANNVEISKRIDRHQLLEEYLKADVLLHFYYPEKMDGALSSKLFEYSMMNRIVLSFSSKKGLVSRFIEQSRIGFSCESSDVQEISELFAKAYNNPKVEPDFDYLRQFEVPNQVKLMIDLIEKL